MGDYRLSAHQPKPRARPSLRQELAWIAVDAALEAGKQLQRAAAPVEAHTGLDAPPGLRTPAAASIDPEHVAMPARKSLDARSDGAADGEIEVGGPGVVDVGVSGHDTGAAIDVESDAGHLDAAQRPRTDD